MRDKNPYHTAVEELRQLGDEELLAAWRANDEALDARVTDRHPLRLRHYAFRAVAVQRFGAEGHVRRRKGFRR